MTGKTLPKRCPLTGNDCLGAGTDVLPGCGWFMEMDFYDILERKRIHKAECSMTFLAGAMGGVFQTMWAGNISPEQLMFHRMRKEIDADMTALETVAEELAPTCPNFVEGRCSRTAEQCALGIRAKTPPGCDMQETFQARLIEEREKHQVRTTLRRGP